MSPRPAMPPNNLFELQWESGRHEHRLLTQGCHCLVQTALRILKAAVDFAQRYDTHADLVADQDDIAGQRGEQV